MPALGRHAGAVVLLGLIARATIAAAADEEIQFSGDVTVGPDGNGWVGARFPTTVDGDDVTYYLDVSTGCADGPALEPEEFCPPPVKALAVTLNGEVVFRTASAFRIQRTQITLHLVGTTDNDVMVSADGQLAASARFSLVAVRRGAP